MERGRRGVKVEGFIFCVSVGTSSPARVCYQCIKNFHQKSFLIVVIGAVLRVMARRTSLAHHIITEEECACVTLCPVFLWCRSLMMER